MKTESRSETPPEDPARAVLAAWQRLAVALAVVATLAGLALGGFAGAVDPPPDTVSAATPQPRSLVAGTEAPAGSLVGDPKLGDSTAEDSLVWDPEGGRRGIEGGAERTEGGSGGGSEGGSEGVAGGLWAPLLAKGGLSFFLAFCVGYALRAALRMFLLAVGLAALAVFGLQYAGLLGEVRWERLAEFWDVGVAAAREQLEGFSAFVTGSLPSVASGTLGVVTGFRRTR